MARADFAHAGWRGSLVVRDIPRGVAGVERPAYLLFGNRRRLTLRSDDHSAPPGGRHGPQHDGRPAARPNPTPWVTRGLTSGRGAQPRHVLRRRMVWCSIRSSASATFSSTLGGTYTGHLLVARRGSCVRTPCPVSAPDGNDGPRTRQWGIHAGDRVVEWKGSAVRDLRQVFEPDSFLVRRPPNVYLSSRHGIPFSLRTKLARVEIKLHTAGYLASSLESRWAG